MVVLSLASELFPLSADFPPAVVANFEAIVRRTRPGVASGLYQGIGYYWSLQ